MEIDSKRRMFQLLDSDLLGNHTRIWWTPEELIASNFLGPVAIRSTQEFTKFKPGMSTEACLAYYRELTENCPTTNLVDKSSLIFHEWPPEETRIAICHFGYKAWDQIPELVWSRERNINDNQHVVGGRIQPIVACQEIIGYYNWEKVQRLLDLFPLHMIEFTVHSQRVGILDEDIVFWEVRKR